MSHKHLHAASQINSIIVVEPVKLPEIPFKPRPAPKVRKTTWTAIEENDEEEVLRPRSPPADDKEALKVLKAKKAKRRSEYR